MTEPAGATYWEGEIISLEIPGSRCRQWQIGRLNQDGKRVRLHPWADGRVHAWNDACGEYWWELPDPSQPYAK